MITLDGSYGEGGGQILRTALALSALTQLPFKIVKIHENRVDSGLKPQHLACINAVKKICNASVEGEQIGSKEISFFPKKIDNSNLKIDIGTAGSVTLLLQSILLPCLFAKKNSMITILGGTDVQWSPQVNYVQEVFIPQIKRFVGKIDLKLIKRGYYPAGGGEIVLKIKPKFKIEGVFSLQSIRQKLAEIKQIVLVEQNNLMLIKGISHASTGLSSAKVAERQAHGAQDFIAKKLHCSVNIRNEYAETLSAGSGICLWAVFSKLSDDIDIENPIIVGADVLGEKAFPAEQVGQKCAEILLKTVSSGVALDDFLSDQLIPLIALIKGSRIKPANITSHLTANIYVVEQFFGCCIRISDGIIESY